MGRNSYALWFDHYEDRVLSDGAAVLNSSLVKAARFTGPLAMFS